MFTFVKWLMVIQFELDTYFIKELWTYYMKLFRSSNLSLVEGFLPGISEMKSTHLWMENIEGSHKHCNRVSIKVFTNT